MSTKFKRFFIANVDTAFTGIMVPYFLAVRPSQSYEKAMKINSSFIHPLWTVSLAESLVQRPSQLLIRSDRFASVSAACISLAWTLTDLAPPTAVVPHMIMTAVGWSFPTPPAPLPPPAQELTLSFPHVTVYRA